MTIDTAWFSGRLADRKMSQRGLAKIMGLDPAAMSLMLRGKRKMTLDEAAQLANILRVSTHDVLEHAGINVVSDRRAKVIGYMTGDASVHLYGEGNHDMIDAPSDMPPENTAAVQARTAGTDLQHVDGYHMFFADEHVSPSSCVGQLVIAAVKGNGLVLAHVYKGYQRGSYNLMNWRNQLTTNQELLWVMPVFWIRTVV